MGAFAKVGLES